MNFYDQLKSKSNKIKSEIERIKTKDNQIKYKKIINELEFYLENNKKILQNSKDEGVKKIISLTQCLNLCDRFSDYHDNGLTTLENIKNIIINAVDEIKRMSLLLKLTQENKKIILIGGNGSGKSSLADYLKKSITSNVIVFPAQKHLFLEDGYNEMSYQKQQAQSYLKQMNAKRKDSNDSKMLMRSIRAIVNEHMDILYKSDQNKGNDRPQSLFDKFKDIYEQLIPEIQMEIDTNNRILYPTKNDSKYSLDSMSEGEKSIILYILQVLLANQNSYIIVDEPESHLNVAIINKLWDLLCSERSDCKFVFISHNIDFINSRGNIHLVWCKSFVFPNHWELEDILNINNLPLKLITELIGNKKPVIFCEGEKNSLDYRVYSNLFLKTHTIYPVKGHKDVIANTKAYSKLPLFRNQKAYGIIDGDLTDDFNKKTLFNENIIVLPFNEIEMFLLNEEIIKETLSESYKPEKVKEKFQKFKEKFILKISSSKEKIVLNKLKKEIDSHLEKEKIQRFDTFGSLEKSFYKITNLDLKTLKEKYTEELTININNKDYNKLLEWCSLKKEISCGLANIYLEEDYINKTIFRLSKNDTLKTKLIDKYFYFKI